MKLEISHLTRYQYVTPAAESVNEIRLTPGTNHRQSCYQHVITVEPNVSLFSYDDFFGNRVHSFSVASPHRELMIQTHSIVVTDDREPERIQHLSMQEQLDLLQDDKFINRYAEFLMETKYTYINPEVAEQIMGAGAAAAESVLDQLKHISEAIFTQFEYDPYATHVKTTIEETVKMRRGVCQDFAHLMIAICKSIHVPARYISGYNYVGDLQGGHADYAQASHAWVEAYVPGMGWVGFDPTNNGEINWRYVKLCHGRDYEDIVPVKGIYRGSDQQQLEVIVDVKQID
jgi:transglutaminase-like putative cysteine protease